MKTLSKSFKNIRKLLNEVNNTRAGPAGHSGRRSQSVAGKGTKGIQSLANCFVTQGKDKWILPVPPLLWLTFSEGFRGSTRTSDGLNERSNRCHDETGFKKIDFDFDAPSIGRQTGMLASVCLYIYILVYIYRAGCLMDDQCTFSLHFLSAMRLRRDYFHFESLDHSLGRRKLFEAI